MAKKLQRGLGRGLGALLGDDVVIVDGGAGTARHTKRCLEERGWLREGAGSLQMENSSGQQRLLDLGMELLNR